jgi:hypothetical protein
MLNARYLSPLSSGKGRWASRLSKIVSYYVSRRRRVPVLQTPNATPLRPGVATNKPSHFSLLTSH